MNESQGPWGRLSVKEETPPYRMITTFNAQLTKWTFLLCGVIIGFLLGHWVF